MTNEEAINHIRKLMIASVQASVGANPRPIAFAFELAIDALQKQIPKKAKITLRGTTDWNTVCHCPSCNGFLVDTDKFCHKCGQALDWGGMRNETN